MYKWDCQAELNDNKYYNINQSIVRIIENIRNSPDDHVCMYDCLVQHIEEVDSAEYQGRYKKYWGIRRWRGDAWCDAYFQRLKAAIGNVQINLEDLLLDMHKIPTNRKKTHAIDFSFCSKLCHMQCRDLPIYDSKISTFYQYKSNLYSTNRVQEFMGFYRFLINEYERILTEELLAVSIDKFKNDLHPIHFTDKKIIDSLIWASGINPARLATLYPRKTDPTPK